MYKLYFAKVFKEDISKSIKYIRETLNAPLAAEKMKALIKAKYKILKINPLLNAVVLDEYLANKGIRFAMVKNYMMFYVVKNKKINFIRFLYGRRDWVNILAGAGVEC